MFLKHQTLGQLGGATSENMSIQDKNTPRRWTEEEDTALINFLLGMFKDGNKWKSKDGFKSGYLAHLEKLFKEKMPNSGFKASNIDSRLGYLKKCYYALHEIKRNGSGFGWDDNLKMVTGDRKLFDEWCKSHKDAKGLYKKSFPLFDGLDEIYSKYRATGAKSAMPMDRDDDDLLQENIQDNILDNLQEVAALNQNEVSQTEVSGTNKRSRDSGSSQRTANKRKRKEIESLSKNIGAMVTELIQSSIAQVEKLITMFEATPKNVKAGLLEELCKVPGISEIEALSLCTKMSEDEVVIFCETKNDRQKCIFLNMILNNAEKNSRK